MVVDRGALVAEFVEALRDPGGGAGLVIDKVYWSVVAVLRFVSVRGGSVDSCPFPGRGRVCAVPGWLSRLGRWPTA